jgi:hypothetical protein
MHVQEEFCKAWIPWVSLFFLSPFFCLSFFFSHYCHLVQNLSRSLQVLEVLTLWNAITK